MENNKKEIIEDKIYETVENILNAKDIEKNNIVTMEDFIEIGKQNYEEFDNLCYNKGDGYKIPNFEEIEKQLEGVESGLYIIAGESNSGKTAVMNNIIKSMCSYRENKLFGIYYSLDDSKNEIIPRMIAMEQDIPIGVASKPKRYENMLEDCPADDKILYEEYLKKRKIGLEKLKSETDIFLIEDSSKIKNSTDMLNHMKRVQTYVKTIDPEMNIVVAVDALNDINLDPAVFGRINKEEKIGEVGKFLKQITVDLNIPMFVSAHLRKLNGNRRPILDDLREANTLVYEASVIWLVFNDVSKNKGNAKIYWNDNMLENKLGAILEMDWAKNKKSHYKGRTFLKFRPYTSKMKMCSKDDTKRYETLVLQ